MINTALELLYSMLFSYRERIYKKFLPVLISKCIFFLFQNSIPVSQFLLRILYIGWVPCFCWRISFKCLGIKGPSIVVLRVTL